GSDPRFLLEFPMRWPGAEVVRLDDNHRSSPQVVAAASAVLGRQSSGAMRSSQPDGPLPALRSYASEDAEAAGVAAQMRSAHARGLAWTELAALARTNAQLVAIARALEGAGVPFRSVAPDEEVEGAAGAPRLRDGQAPGRPATPDSGGAAGTSAPAALGVPAPEEAGATLCSFHRAKGLQWRAVWVCGLEAGIVPIGYATDPAALAEERRLLYVALTRAEHELYCSWARQRRAATGVPLRRDPSPWLPTLAAHCAGAEESSSAVRGQDGDAALVDFLAAARRRLSRASRRAPGNALAPSALLGEILEEEEAAGSPRASALAAAERLRQWRRRMARASGVPPHVLMHDATLEVIAARRPSSPEELLTVPGLGPVKVARYGRAILEVVRASADAAIPARA
ncbi:MAG TPA: 3'-5' exonuclease, partial [Acidimicrobiales bacterium]|nr:3'-5' exonuclease [Acidimicrobiales bacterium]